MQSKRAHKVLIYATSSRGLLVFEEPDFPNLPVQVPGGTIETRETPLQAARREFLEETGHRIQYLKPLCVNEYCFEKNGLSHHHIRHCFHGELPKSTPQSWEHFEKYSSEGDTPLLFRYFWIDLDDASRLLGFGMAQAIDLLVASI